MQVTFATADGRSETLDLAGSLEVGEVKGFVEAMLSVPAADQLLLREGRPLGTAGTLEALGVKDGDMIMVSTAAAAAPAAAAPPAAASGGSAGSSLASLIAASGGSEKVFWEGMSLDDVMGRNQNPEHVVDIVQSTPRLLQELNFHNPELAAHMRKDRGTAVRELRTFIMMNAAQSTLGKMTADRKDQQMEQRLRDNPMDEEANKYFGEKMRKEQVQESYVNMMNHYPETLGRVLMLYIEVEINGVALQAFVDSGAQTSVISAKCAERCNLLRLVDERFSGQVVGVGTGRTLGRVHLAEFKISGNHFPISLTVMDDSAGLGDKNMEFLLGLDMLKRHHCTIDLAQGRLLFTGAAGVVSTPFLHEKDLPEAKGGTKGYNPNATDAPAPAPDQGDSSSGGGGGGGGSS